MFEQLKDASLIEILAYMFVFGTGIGFFNRVPMWTWQWFQKAYRAIRKTELEELVAEAPHGCQSEAQCHQRLTSAVSQAVQGTFLPVSHQLEEVDRKVGELNTEVKGLDTKMGTKLDRVHSRIDSHLNEEAKAAAGKVA